MGRQTSKALCPRALLYIISQRLSCLAFSHLSLPTPPVFSPVSSSRQSYLYNMAEVFGVAAGAAGFTSLLVQFVDAISTLKEIQRQIDKAPTDLNDIVNDFEFLVKVMSAAEELPSQKVTFFAALPNKLQ